MQRVLQQTVGAAVPALALEVHARSSWYTEMKHTDLTKGNMCVLLSAKSYEETSS